MYACMYAVREEGIRHSHYGTHVEVRDFHEGSLLSPCRSQGSNSDPQASQQTAAAFAHILLPHRAIFYLLLLLLLGFSERHKEKKGGFIQWLGGRTNKRSNDSSLSFWFWNEIQVYAHLISPHQGGVLSTSDWVSASSCLWLKLFETSSWETSSLLAGALSFPNMSFLGEPPFPWGPLF